MAAPEHGVLGKATDYQFEYNPGLLFPISRQAGRELLGIHDMLPFHGIDRWTAYELSWLNPQGLPQVAIAEFDFRCESPNIIESKSLKLYLNSFNQSFFAGVDDVQQTIAADLSRACGLAVEARLYPLAEYVYLPANDCRCLDSLQVACSIYQPEPGLLATGTRKVTEKLSSHLFRSLCPVTGQPDWASVFIAYTGKEIIAESLLQYLVSYRNHQGFHEQCVEQIFVDVIKHCQPEQLAVYARFMRRGGLDINPLRSTGEPLISAEGREIRQ